MSSSIDATARSAPGVVAVPATEPPHADMVWIPGGDFVMGSDRHYPEEAPAHRVRVDGFWIDRFPVTNERFARFVEAAAHATLAELPPNPAEYPGAAANMLCPGSLVFEPPNDSVDPSKPSWWSFRRGADWLHPLGPGSSLRGLGQHPVVHVTYSDALSFASHYGMMLPTEAEWELAARGGLDRAEYAWGDELTPGGQPMANFWQGSFPFQNTMEDGYARTSPVDAFPANGYGVHDMIGNVWEWTIDWYRPRQDGAQHRSCCIPNNPRSVSPDGSYDPRPQASRIPRKVLKGGSHLCAPNYCRRYRPAARHPQAIDTSSCHVGFRCIVRPVTPSILHTGERR
jgi:sulfatase modifying factor 1